MEVKCCTFKGKEYTEVDRIVNNGKIYAYLVNEKDEYDFMIRLVEEENGVEYYNALSGEKEFELALMLYLKKNAKEIISEQNE